MTKRQCLQWAVRAGAPLKAITVEPDARLMTIVIPAKVCREIANESDRDIERYTWRHLIARAESRMEGGR